MDLVSIGPFPRSICSMENPWDIFWITYGSILAVTILKSLFCLFFWPSTGFDEGHIFSGDHIKSLWKIAAVNSDFLWSIDHGLHIKIAYMMDEMWLLDDKQDSLWAHLTGSGSESSLPEVSSVVASGRVVVISIGMESTAPSATRRQPRNFSISPEQCRYNQSLTRCQRIAGESGQPEERYLPCVSTHARGWLVRTKGARERVDLYSRQEMAHA